MPPNFNACDTLKTFFLSQAEYMPLSLLVLKPSTGESDRGERNAERYPINQSGADRRLPPVFIKRSHRRYFTIH
jgi:hypothetical protein